MMKDLMLLTGVGLLYVQGELPFPGEAAGANVALVGEVAGVLTAYVDLQVGAEMRRSVCFLDGVK